MWLHVRSTCVSPWAKQSREQKRVSHSFQLCEKKRRWRINDLPSDCGNTKRKHIIRQRCMETMRENKWLALVWRWFEPWKKKRIGVSCFERSRDSVGKMSTRTRRKTTPTGRFPRLSLNSYWRKISFEINSGPRTTSRFLFALGIKPSLKMEWLLFEYALAPPSSSGDGFVP